MRRAENARGKEQPTLSEFALQVFSDPSSEEVQDAVLAYLLQYAASGSESVKHLLTSMGACITKALARVILDSRIPLASRFEAIVLCSRVNRPALIARAILSVAENGPRVLRLIALQTLGQLKPRGRNYRRFVLKQLRSRVPAVREAAIDAAGWFRLTSPEALGLYKLALQDRSREIRLKTLAIVGDIGLKSRSFVDQIVPLVKDSDWRVRAEAWGILSKLSVTFPDKDWTSIVARETHPRVRNIIEQVITRNPPSSQPG